MATPGHGKAHRVWYDHYSVSAFANSDALDIARDMAETTAFEDAAKTSVPGKYGGTSSFSGFLDLADDGFDEVQFADLADGAHWICRAFTGPTRGNVAYETIELNSGNGRAADIANVVALNWSGQVHGQVGRGAFLTTGAGEAITATGGLTSVNYGGTYGTVGATSIQVVTARVLAVSGTGSITIHLEQSSDDGSGDAFAQVTGWTSTEQDPGTNVNIAVADALTFTGVGSAKMTRTGAIEAYQRINVTAYSTFTSVTLLVTTTTLGG